MSRKLTLCFVLLILFVAGSGCSSSAADNDPYNLHFVIRPDVRWKTTFLQAFDFDSSQTVSGKHPLMFRKSLKSLNWNTSTLYQRIILPRTVNEPIRFTIRNNCGYLNKAVCYVNRYDEKMNLVSQDSVDINADGWNTHSLTLAPATARVLDITFLVKALSTGYYERLKDPDFMQFMAFGPMEIKIGNKDIAALGTKTLTELSHPVKLDPERMVPLDSDPAKTIAPLNDKKIIALGETMHFNDEVSKVVFDVIKKRIINNNCRIVMLETSYYYGFMLNHYASGAKVTPVFTELMNKSGQWFFSPSEYAFFDWLREYNRNRKRKVLLLGIDDTNDLFIRPELEVLDAAISSPAERQPLIDLFDDLARCRYKKAEREIETYRPFITDLLGEEPYELFRYVLARNAQTIDDEYTSSSKYFDENSYRLIMRDQAQYNTAQQYLTTFLNADETACIYAHYGHLAKSPIGGTQLPAGYYLKREYGEEYAPVAVVVGGGTSTMRMVYERVEKNFTLTEPPQNSIERAAAQLSDSCFYYPFTDENYPFSFIRRSGTVVIGSLDSLEQINQFENLTSPKGLSDGFIYVPEGRPMCDPDTINMRKRYAEVNLLIYNRLSGFKKINAKK